MRAVVQRVTEASVAIDKKTVGRTERGLLIFVGAGKGDEDTDVQYLVKKILGLRIFEDENGKMNKSVVDIGGGLLVISQFTLYGDCRKGRRPSFDAAEEPHKARSLYEDFVNLCRDSGLSVETGEFGADMKVSLLNDGPVTILLDSKKLF